MSLNPPSYPKEPVKKDIVINNNSKVEIPFSSKVPSINRLFLSKSSEFCAKLQKYLKFENDKRTNSIINSVLSKYLAPLFIQIKQQKKSLWENFNISEDIKKKYNKCSNLVNNLVKRMSISPINFLDQYEYSIGKETPFNDYIKRIIKWINEIRIPKEFKKNSNNIKGLVLFGPNNLDKRLLCSIICKELGLKVMFSYKKMVEFNVSMHMEENAFKKVETGKSYSLQFVCSDTKMPDEFTIKSKPSLIFIDDIETIAKYTPIEIGKFYKQIVDFLKESKCPIIISTENIPLGLSRYYNQFQFMHILPNKTEVPYMVLYMVTIYLLESSGITKNLINGLISFDSIESIANQWKQELESIKEFWIDKIDTWIREENYDTTKILIKLYMDLYMLNEKIDLCTDIELNDIEEKLDYESIKEFSNIGKNKVSKISQIFLHSLPIQRAYTSEFQLILEILKVF